MDVTVDARRSRYGHCVEQASARGARTWGDRGSIRAAQLDRQCIRIRRREPQIARRRALGGRGATDPSVESRLSRPVQPVADGFDVTRAEFEYAVTHEGAMTVDDVVDRRTASASSRQASVSPCPRRKASPTNR